MADFKTHLTASTLLGVGYGGAAYAMYQLPPSSCVLAAGLCSVSGMLPDIDSGPGRPLKEITTFLAAVVPAMLFDRLLHLGLSQSSLMLVTAGLYVGIRFGLAECLKRYTVHRGMFHSLPAAVIFGQLAYLLFYDADPKLRWFMAGSVVVGFLSHLLLDELYSVQWDGRPRLKKSFGTALKLFSDSWAANLSAYAKLGLLAFVMIKEPGLVEQIYQGNTHQVVRNLTDDLGISLPAAIPASSGSKAPATHSAPKPPATR